MDITIRILLAAMTGALLAGCIATPASAPSSAPAPRAKAVGLANPASVQCIERGGTLLPQRDANGGEYAICVLPDGSRCEEWARFRGECGTGDDAKPRRPGEGAASPAARERAPTGSS